MSPRNASQSADGFRFYEWVEDGVEHRLLSVSSINRLKGEGFQLVNWQLNNIVNVAMGTTKRPAIGKRGQPLKDKWVYVLDGPFPGEFATRLAATEGKQAGLDEVRKWLRAAADKPRDTAAVRGSIVHEAIELGATVERIDMPYLEAAIERLSSKDRKKVEVHGLATDEDVDFVRACIANYWHMRATEPFVVLAREPQLFNLTVGYAGSADVFVWRLPAGATLTDLMAYQKLANQQKLTAGTIIGVGGTVALWDWKTSSGIHTDQVVQTIAYISAEFVGRDNVRDHRLTDILTLIDKGAICHIRPDGWAIHEFDFEQPIVRAYLGSVAYARFVATYNEPDALFTRTSKGAA